MVCHPCLANHCYIFPLSLCFPPTHRAYFKSQQPTGYINNNHLGALLNHNIYSTILFATSVLATYKCRQERTHSRTLFVLLQTTFLHVPLSPIHHSFSPNSIASSSSFFYFYKINVYRLDNMPWLQCISHTTRNLIIIYLLLLFPNTRHSPPHNRHSSEPGLESERHKHPVHSRQHHRKDNSPHFIPPRATQQPTRRITTTTTFLSSERSLSFPIIHTKPPNHITRTEQNNARKCNAVSLHLLGGCLSVRLSISLSLYRV